MACLYFLLGAVLTFTRAGAMDVLEDITFDVEPGQKIGICGRTGRYLSSGLPATQKGSN